MAAITDSVYNVFFLDNFFTAITPTSYASFKNAFEIVLIFIAFSLALAAIGMIALITASAVLSRRSSERAINSSSAFASLALLFATIWPALATAAAFIANTANRVANFLWANIVPILIVTVAAIIGWVWGFGHSDIIGIFLRTYSTVIVPFWSVVPMYLMLGLWYIFATAWAWINFLAIRVPSAMLTGAIFDSATCTADTWTLLVLKSVESGILFSSTWQAWSLTGQNMLFVAPNFGPWAKSIAELIGITQNFLYCLCASGSFITAPFFSALVNGNPSITSETPGFVAAVNATLNLPIVIGTDIVRPFYLGVKAIEDGESFFDVLRAAHISVNGTADTGLRFVNGTLYALDNILQQYYILILDAATDGGPLVTNPGAFPRLISCISGGLWAPFELFKWGFNVLVAFVTLDLFTYDGQLVLRLNGPIDMTYSPYLCFCDFIGWLDKLFRAIADEITGGGACGNTTGADIDESIGGCIFYVAAATFEMACCIITTVINIMLQLFYNVFELIKGTIYTLIARADDASHTRCNVISTEDIFYCSIPRNPGAWMFFDYLDFQLGFRDVGTPCSRAICNMPSCTPIIGDLGDNAECVNSALYGVGNYCLDGLNKCIETDESCASGGGIPSPTDCITTFDFATCKLGSCKENACTERLPITSFPCNCQCHENVWRTLGNFIVRLVDCIGKWFVNSFGEGAEFLRCFLTNIASFIIELLLLLIDVIGQLPRIFSDPSALELTGLQLSHAFEGICNCIADGLITFVSGGSASGDIVSVFQAIGKLIQCVCKAIVDIFTGVVSLINSLILAVRGDGGDLSEQVKEAFIVIFQGIIEFSSILYYFLAALFYGLTITDAGNALMTVGNLVCENAAILTESIIDFFTLVINCIIGIVNFFIFPFICAFAEDLGYADYTQCYNETVLSFLFECLGDLLTQILELLDFIFGDFWAATKCIVQLFSCVFGDAIEPSICTPNSLINVTDSTCALVEFSCLIEQGLCEIGIPADLGCDAFACDEIGFLCDFYALFCRLDLILLGITEAFDDAVNAGIDVLREICYVIAAISPDITGEDCDDFWTYIDISGGFPFLDAIPPTACCTTDGSNSASPENFNYDLECSNIKFLDWGWIVPPIITGGQLNANCNMTCTITKHACWTSLTKAEILNSTLNGGCCQSPSGTSAFGPFYDPCCETKKRQFNEYNYSLNETEFYQWNASISARRNYALIASKNVAFVHTLNHDNVAPKKPETYTTEEIFNAIQIGYDGKQTFITDFCKSALQQYQNVSVANLFNDNNVSANIFTKFQKSICATFLHSIQSNPAVNRALQHAGESDYNVTTGNNAFTNILAKLHAPTLLWPLRFIVGIMYNTPRMLFQYISDPLSNNELRLADDGVIGAPYLQKMPKNCNADTFFAAAIVDLIRPNIGALLRVTVQSTRAAAAYTSLAWNTTTLTYKPRKSTASLLYLANFTAKTLQILQKGRVGPGVAGALAQLAHYSENRVEILKKRSFSTVQGVSKTFSKRQSIVPVQTQQISAWRDTLVERLNAKGTRMMRTAVFGTENIAVIRQRREARILANDNDDDPCDLAASPWQCCPEQAVCLNCSVIDRVTWAVQDSFTAVLDYYGDDYVNTQLPCIVEAAESVNYMIVPPNQSCPPSTLCKFPECETNNDCILSAGTSASASLQCDALTHRCIIIQEACTPELAGKNCYEHDENFTIAHAGLCSGGAGNCIALTPPFSLHCKCPDTFLTVNKTVPFWLSRFWDLPLPCQLNVTCIQTSSLPPGTNITVPANHSFTGTFERHKTANGTAENYDMFIINAINGISNGSGTALVTAIENFMYSITSFSDNGGIAGLWREFFLCDFEDDWFCPLTDDSPDACCNDQCQIRKQGAGLFSGLVWSLAILIIPLILCNVCVVCSGCIGIATSIWSFFFVTIWLAFAYGGGFFCYTPGLLLIVLPVYVAIVSLVTALLRIICCGRVGTVFVTLISGLLYGIGVILVVAAVFPGIPTCFGMDLYTVAREIVPPCFPVPPTLIDRTQPGATAPCGTFLNTEVNTTLPAIIDCTTTPLLADTRFRDGLDNVFYIVEWVRPGTNANLTTYFNGSSAFRFLTPYAGNHTTEAHASAGTVAETCFWLTAPSLFVAVFVAFTQLTFALLFLAATILLLALLFMPCFVAARTWGLLIGQVYDGLHGPEQDVGPKVKTE